MREHPPYHPVLAPRRSLWRIFAAPVLLGIAGLAWTVFWFYAAAQVTESVDGWLAREAKQGREISCGDRQVLGYPFRLEVVCKDVGIALTALAPPARAHLDRLMVVAQVYDPKLLITELTSPLSIDGGNAARPLTARWTLAQASLRGRPDAPQRMSVALDELRVTSGDAAPLMQAARVELHGRIADDSSAEKPVVELVLRTIGASAPTLHALAAEPADSDIALTLRGLHDVTPKPWPQRFRDIQAAGGRIEVTQARVRQGELLATARGTLGVDPAGHLAGELDLVVAGIEKVIAPLGLEELLAKAAPQAGLPGIHASDINSLIGTLDSIVPGLGNIARRNAGAGVAAGLNALGKATELEGRKALALPLRFAEGTIYLGALPVGRTPALF
jgi:hypothetical protein